MTAPYAGKPARNVQALERWLGEWSKESGVTPGRLRRQVAVVAVAAMLDAVRDAEGQHLFQVKGGSSLELRFGSGARTSKDLDAVYRGAMAAAHAHVTTAVAVGWQGFKGEVGKLEQIEVPGLTGKPIRFRVKLTYNGKGYATLPMEVSPPEGRSTDSPDAVIVRPLAEVRLPTPGVVPCLSLRYQVAQKLHACTAQLGGGRPNDRAHDLADLILIENLAGDQLNLAETRAACIEIFNLRARQPWPPALLVYDHWPLLWQEIVEADRVPVTNVNEAADRVRALITKIDDAA